MTPSPNAGWTLAVVCLAAVLLTLDITIVNVALPEISGELSARLDGMQWTVNGYTLAFAALLLPSGSVSDRVGRRAVFTAGVALFTTASAACGAAWNPGALAAFRIAQGVGGAMVMGTAMALLAGAYPAGRARRRAIGAFSAAGGAAAGLGPLAGGLLVDTLGWRWIFWINVPVGLLLLAGALLRLREPARETSDDRIDVLGAVLAVAMLFVLNFALITGPDRGWGSAPTLTALVAGPVLLMLFIALQARRPHAVLDIRLFRIPSFMGAMLLTFLARICSFGILPYLILWLQGMLGHSPLETGLRLLAMTLPILVVAPLAGRLGQRIPASRLMAAGFALITVAFLLMARVEPASNWSVAFPGLVLLGVGGALAFPPLLGVTLDLVPREQAGMASGLSNTFFPLGTATGVAAFGAIFTARISAELPGQAALVAAGRFDQVNGPALETARTAFTGALSATCLVAAAAGLAGVAISLLLIRARDLEPVPMTA
ncbi:MFS transporter [Herbidospora galbida]|uniref:MFS transporter n=1 Tax=Herbidospora galbida TaxID=2575442 RepID=A0A4U3MSK4_9ACTN|nr:MFS transporter [Herbidospora galbida]TKK91437.1 MFS transporter [Herbidospora galbida]